MKRRNRWPWLGVSRRRKALEPGIAAQGRTDGGRAVDRPFPSLERDGGGAALSSSLRYRVLLRRMHGPALHCRLHERRAWLPDLCERCQRACPPSCRRRRSFTANTRPRTFSSIRRPQRAHRLGVGRAGGGRDRSGQSHLGLGRRSGRALPAAVLSRPLARRHAGRFHLEADGGPRVSCISKGLPTWTKRKARTNCRERLRRRRPRRKRLGNWIGRRKGNSCSSMINNSAGSPRDLRGVRASGACPSRWPR